MIPIEPIDFLGGSQDKKPLISVIVPVYNVEPYLDQCIQSIVNQTYKNLEIILVDDGSPDRCPEKCDEWAKQDSRIIVLHKRNGGLSSARNAGLDKASGEFIGFIDSDDFIAVNMYETLYVLMKSNGADFSATQFEIVHDNTQLNHPAFPKMGIIRGDPTLAFTLAGCGRMSYCVTDKLFKRNIFCGVRFPDTAQAEDMFVAYRIFDRTKIFVFDSEHPAYYYRQHAGSATHSDERISLDYVKAARYMVSICEDKYPEAMPYALLGYLTNLVWGYEMLLRNGLPGEWAKNARTIQYEIGSIWHRVIDDVDPYFHKIGFAERTRWQLISEYPNLFSLLYALFRFVRPSV